MYGKSCIDIHPGLKTVKKSIYFLSLNGERGYEVSNRTWSSLYREETALLRPQRIK
jgi:hypothetical protein